MNRGIYATASGMLSLQKWMDMTANNLANVNTTGYKQDEMLFHQALESNINTQNGTGKNIGTLGNGTIPAQQFTNFEEGPIQPTSNPLDLALNSDSQMFTVKTSQGIRYTRDGSFTLNANRDLVTQNGDQVLDDSQQPISIPTGDPTISGNGTITVQTPKGPVKVAQIGISSGTFTKEGDNMYTGSNTQIVEKPTLVPNALEGSNANPIIAMTDLIKIGRAYDLAQKSMTNEDQNSQTLLQSLG